MFLNPSTVTVTHKMLVTRGLVSKETVVLRRWGRETQILNLSTELIR